jgi:hypothetical protein
MTHLFSRLLSLLVLFLSALHLPAAAQAPDWQSAQAVAVATAASSNYSYNSSKVQATAVDAAGNVFLAGNFSNTVVLGSITLTSLGGTDVFVAKFNPTSNQFVWAQRAGGTGDDRINADLIRDSNTSSLLSTGATLAVSGTSVYVAGVFRSFKADFGPATLTNEAGTRGGTDVFVAKLTDAGSTGSFVWAQRAGGEQDDAAYGLAVSGTSVYVAGDFNSRTADFGATTLTNTGNTSAHNVFVAKLTDAGSTSSFMWVQQVGSTGRDYAAALAVSGTSVYVAGFFGSPTASFGTTILTNADADRGYFDAFVAKLTDAGSTGSFVWAQQAGGTGRDYATALAVSGTSVYVAGTFDSSTASIGTTTLTNTNTDADVYAGAGACDAFVAKLTDAGSTGSFVWAQQIGGTGANIANTLAVSGTSLYVAGDFTSHTARFGTTTLTNADADRDRGDFDVYVAKLTDAGTTGSFAWAQRAGSQGTEIASALAVSGTNVYVAGNFASTRADFGTTTLLNPDRFAYLGFLASLSDGTPTATMAAGPREPAALFPNPARYAATLRLPAGAARTALTLTDALGRAVRHYPSPTDAEATLDLRGLPAGLYLLRGAGPAQRLLVE